MDRSKLQTGLKKSDRPDINHLRGRLDFDNVILPSLGLDAVKQNGDWITCHCPDFYGNHANGDSSPSFAVNVEEMVYNCFVCGGGPLIELVALCLQIPEAKALVWLEEHSNLAPSSRKDFASEVENILSRVAAEVEPMPDLNPQMLRYYDEVHPYVYRRGLSPEVVSRKRIGFSREHVAISIPHWHFGKLVGIQFRHLAQDESGRYLCPHPGCADEKKIPKYKNTSKFPRETTLYNYDDVRAAKVIVVESPMTALYLMSHGVENVVATFGSGVNQGQASLLWKFNEGVYIWPDNDAAGLITLGGSKPKKGRFSWELYMLQKVVPLFIIPAVPGEKGDPGDLDPDEIQRYLDAAYPSIYYATEGLRVGCS